MVTITRISLLSAALVLGWLGPVSAQNDVADVPTRQLSVAGDPNLSYFLIGPVAKEAPSEGLSCAGIAQPLDVQQIVPVG